MPTEETIAATAADIAKAERALARRDAVMRRLIRAHGPCTITPQKRSPYEALMNAVAHQQLHANAAVAILKRFVALTPGVGFPKPAEVVALSESAVRGVGFSGAKAAALKDIAAKTIDGIVPSARAARAMSDEELIAHLVQVRGVGRWTVEMFLIFTLGRLNVWPVDDYGVRAGYAIAYALDDMPKPKVLRALGEVFQPYRSIAAWYCWRAADAAKEKKKT